MTSLSTNFNVSPYFDDYDEDKDFYRILFRPSVAVQARELTQLQTILQKQIQRFGDHVFKDGSVVEGVAITYFPNTHYISVSNQLDGNGINTNTNIEITSLPDTYLITDGTDSNTSVRATIRLAKSGLVATQPETNRFYLNYIFTGIDASNNDVETFTPGNKLFIYNQNQSKFGTLDANNLYDTIDTLSTNSSFTSNGIAYLIKTSDGVIFQKGYFSRVNSHIITVSDFNTNVAGKVVGFNTEESIINDQSDTSLTDNALGYPNENAPGAYRLKLSPTLIAKDASNTTSNTTFFAIVEFDQNEPTEQNDDPEYNKLEQKFATRTYEESGDYTIKPFKIETITNTSNSQSFYYKISSGITYVRGKRIEKIGTTRLETSKAIETREAQNQIVTGNYGNYVIVDEFLGAFDFEQIVEVDLYDKAQNAISDREGISSSPVGSVVGKANVRSIVHFDGTKGNPECKYYLYIFNVRMNSGKSFSTDVKSIYNDGTFGKAKADLVLENNNAIIKDATQNRLYFYNGLSATKRLTSNTGVNDTSFVYTQLKNSTITTAGEVVVTIDTPASGGTERLNYTSGSTISGASLDDFNIYLSANAHTSNLTGTLILTSGNNQITGSGTKFDDEIDANNLIRIVENGSTISTKRVVSVTSNTLLTVDVAPAVSNASGANYQRFFVGGSPLSVNSISIDSNTQFTANLGLSYSNNSAITLDSSQTVRASYEVNRNQAVAIPKLINKNRFVKIDCSNNVATSVGPWDLGFVDVHKIRNIYVGTTYANTNPNRITWFDLDTGQRDSFYDHGNLVIKPQYASEISASSKILVELDHFTANTNAGVGFFSVESYPVDDDNPSASDKIATIEIPNYQRQDLRNFVDFRLRKHNTSTDATTIGTASINPAVSNTSFNVPATGQHIITPDSNFTADFEYYLPRIDLITINPSGEFLVKNGDSSEKPISPFIENDQSPISEIFIPAFPTPLTRDKEIYPTIRTTEINSKTNRRYTMKDIGALDERIKRVEYYTALNAVEQQARDFTIPDANGLDRFKNGIFADPFNSHNVGNVTDFEYKIAIDPVKSIARPFFEGHSVDFKFNSSNSSNVTKTGPLITLPFNHSNFQSQKFATKFRNAVQYVWQWDDILDLFPSYDFYRDEEQLPNINVDLDLAAPWRDFAQSPFGTNWGEWRTTGSRTRQINLGPITETRTTSTQERIISQLNVDTLNQSIDLGNYVTDFSINPYIRSRLVSFVSNNMKPNTKLHAFFDNDNVDIHVAPGVLSGISDVESGMENKVVRQTGNFGDSLVSDSTGFVCGVFRIPAETFRTGDREFRLSNVSDLIVGKDAQITKGTAIYTADNVSITKQSSSINVIQPIISHSSATQTRRQTVSILSANINDRHDGDGSDPIAQSFLISGLPDRVSGVFLTKVGVFFQSKDAELGITLFVCEMENGQPDMSTIIGKTHLTSAEVNISSDGQTETQFVLDYPIYLSNNIEYAIVVQPDGNSPEYNIWVGETGGFDVSTNEQVYSNPHSGILFISANIRSWTPIQKEDLKFNLYRADFTQSSGTASFENEDDDYLSVDGFTNDNTSLAIAVGDTVYSVNSSVDLANTANIASQTLKDSTDPFGIIQYINEPDGEIYLDSSRGGFSNVTNPTIAIYKTSDPSNTSLLQANTLVAHANITSVDNLKYHAVVPKFGILEPARTSLSYSFKGTNTSNVRDNAFVSVKNETDLEYNDVERHALSRSNEITGLANSKSSEFNITLNSDSSYVSPVVSLRRKSSLFIENIINNSDFDEHTRYGNSLTRYISKKVVLADGQEAEDINVFLTAYRPPETDIQIYVKFKNDQDPQDFNDKVWTELEYADNGNVVFTSPTDTEEFIEYKFIVPTINSVATGAFANSGVDTFNPLAGGIIVGDGNTNISAVEHAFNANTNVDNTNEVITITNANTFFAVGDAITYSANGGTVLSNLVDGRKYFVSFSNTSTLALSETPTGANIDLTASSVSEDHHLTGTFFLEDFTVGDRIKVISDDSEEIRLVTNISNNTFMTVDKGLTESNNSAIYQIFNPGLNDGIVEYTNSDGSRFVGFKEFALKIILLSSNPVKVPRLNDVRAIALQI